MAENVKTKLYMHITDAFFTTSMMSKMPNNITYLLISVNDISWVKILCSFQHLVHYIAFMYVFQDITPFYHIVQICVYNTNILTLML